MYVLFISEPGIYESKWRMSTPSGTFFGDTIWVIITVERSGTMALTQQMNSFNVVENGGSADHNNRTFAAANPFSPRKSDGAGEGMNQ